MSTIIVTLYSELVKFIFALQLRLTAPQKSNGIVLCEGGKHRLKFIINNIMNK